MLGWIIGGLIAAAAVTAIVVTITGVINKQRISEAMRSNGIKNALINEIDNCENVVKLEDMDSDKTIEIHGDSVSSSLDEYDMVASYDYLFDEDEDEDDIDEEIEIDDDGNIIFI